MTSEALHGLGPGTRDVQSCTYVPPSLLVDHAVLGRLTHDSHVPPPPPPPPTCCRNGFDITINICRRVVVVGWLLDVPATC